MNTKNGINKPSGKNKKYIFLKSVKKKKRKKTLKI
jgi:hypothetical protein